METRPHDPRRSSRERTVVVVWPSIAAWEIGRALGRLYGLRAGVRIGRVPITVGWLLVALTAPLAGVLYLAGKAPRRPLGVFGGINPACRRYRVTIERVLIEHPFEPGLAPLAEVPLERVERVEVQTLPGQEWFHAADVVLLSQGAELLRLAGVPRPEPFVQTLLESRRAYEITRQAHAAVG